MLKKIRILALSAIVTLLFACGAPAAEVPGDVFFTISTKGFDATINDIESIAGGIVKGSPLQMFVMPGILKMQMFKPNNELGLSEDFIEADKPAHLVFYYDTDRKEPRPIFILPVGDLAKKLEGLGAFGATVERGDDGITTVTAANGSKKYLTDAGNGYAFMAERKKGLIKGKTVLGNWMPAAATTTLGAKVYTQNIYNKFQKDIDGFPEMLNAEIDKDKNEKLPPKAKDALMKASTLYGGMVLDALHGTTLVEINLMSSATGLDLEMIQSVKEGSPLAKLNKVYAESNTKDSNLKAMNYLPEKTYHVIVSDVDPKVSEFMIPYIEEFATIAAPALKEALQIDIAPLFANAIKVSKAQQGGSATCAYFGKDLSSEAISIQSLKSGQGAQAMTDIKASLKELETISASLLEKFKADLDGVEFTIKSTEKKVAGDDVVLFNFKYTTPQKNAGMMPPALMMLQQKRQDQLYCIGAHKDMLIVAIGENSEAAYTAAVKRIDSGTVVFPKSFSKNYAESNNCNILYSGIYLNDLAKQLFDSAGSLLAMVPPQMLKAIEKSVKALPESKAPIKTCLGAQTGKFTMNFSLPVAAIKDVYDEGVKVFMQIQKMKSARPTPQPLQIEEKEEVDVM